MDVEEFDKFADEYLKLHSQNIRVTGEKPEYFAEYKIRDLKRVSSELKVLPDNILDFGTGVGNSIPFLVEYFKDIKIHGVDVSEKSLALARNRFGSLAEFNLFDGEFLPYTNDLFDIAIAACVFHHIPFKKQFHLIKEISRTLKYGGILMIYEHNPYNPLTRYAVKTCPFDENAVLLRKTEVKKILENTGLQIIMQEYRVFFPAFLKILRTSEQYLKWLPLGGQYFVVAKKY